MLSFLPLLMLAAQAPDAVVRHYVRSNRDGSQGEHIVQFRPTRTDVAVYKWSSWMRAR